ncbi:MAG TPA: hypothetical protein VHG34_02325 [Nitrososphaeraceae archaeon]|nr:hypothetical protein [Nitrososphaeraceae archaeon]
MNRNIVLGILLILFSIIICNSSLYTNHIVYAHNFSITDDSALLTLIEQIKAETELVNAYFLASNSISAIEHAKNAANLTNGLNDKLRQSTVADITQVYNNGLYNSTTLALVVANLVDEILRNYGSAYGITYDLTNMSNMMMYVTLNNNNSSSSGHSSMSEKNNAVLVNIYNYQTAQVLSNVVNRLFNDKLSAQAPVNEKVTIDNLEQSIKDLKYAIDNKIRAEYLMEIVHMKIHPMLQSAYDLKLVVR